MVKIGGTSRSDNAGGGINGSSSTSEVAYSNVRNGVETSGNAGGIRNDGGCKAGEGDGGSRNNGKGRWGQQRRRDKGQEQIQAGQCTRRSPNGSLGSAHGGRSRWRRICCVV